jgi:hypothetical protein
VLNSGSCTGDTALVVSMHIASIASLALLGDDRGDVAVSAVDVASGGVGAAAADIACTAIAFLASLHHFFLWVCLPCPGPGMLMVGR